MTTGKVVREVCCELCDGEWNEYGQDASPYCEPIGNYTMFECPRCEFLTQHMIQKSYRKKTRIEGVVL